MSKAPDVEAHVLLGTVLCPSGRLTICDRAAAGDWSPKRYHHSLTLGDPRVSIQTVSNTEGAVVGGLQRTGRSVTIDDVTGQIIQLGGDGFDY